MEFILSGIMQQTSKALVDGETKNLTLSEKFALLGCGF